MNCIESVFGKRRIFLPVIHPVSRDSALRAFDVACAGGADGVWLINQGQSASVTFALVRELLTVQTFWVGVNLLGKNVQSIVSSLDGEMKRLGGIWSDSACVLKDRGEWSGLYFGGVAFKYQREIRPEEEDREIYTALTGALVDVVTTSGPGTGEPADIGKVRRMKATLGDEPLAVASGITPDNVQQYLPYVDAYLVATGIEREFGVFDPDKLRRVADAIHES